MYIKRHLEKEVLEASRQYPCLIVTGPRQVGKTTMLQKLKKGKRKYISLDDPMARTLAIEEPELFLQRYSPPVIIDEIQYAPELFPYIKLYVDKNKVNGDFWLTGSQMFHMMKAVTESLAGRIATIQLFGLSQSEIEGRENIPFVPEKNRAVKKVHKVVTQTSEEIFEKIYYGSMPRKVVAGFNPERFYTSYVNTYIGRDIKDLTQVADEMAFLKFLTAVAARTSQMLNYADIAKDVGISQPTAKQWMSLLISSGIVVLVEPYFNNFLKRAIKAPNMYFMDTGLAAYLTRWDSGKTLEVSAMAGCFFETYVVSELLKTYYNAGKRPPVYYYRDTDKKEIDFIVEKNNVLYPIEIKKTTKPTPTMANNFKVLSKAKKDIGEGVILCLHNDVVPLRENVWAYPAYII